jgi:ABC transport system ATP-binding/permease protein
VPTIVIRHPDGSTEEREVRGRLTVGCDEENDLVLRAGGVSQRHAQFFADGGELVVENVGSAAATLVDGESLEGPRKMKQGVRVLIGEYEVSLKPDRVSVRKLAAVAAPDTTLTDDDAKPVRRAQPQKGGLGPLVAVIAALSAVIVIAAVMLLRQPPSVIILPDPLPPQPCADLEPQLKLARGEPSEKSLAAANAVLECDPLGPEILELKRTIEKELKGAAAAERALNLIDLERDEQALEALKEIPAGTKAWLSIRPKALAVAERIRKENSKACLTYGREGKWVQAQPACEKALEIACQGKSPPDPKDPLLVNLLKARQVNDPSGPHWKCVAVPLIAPDAVTAYAPMSLKEAMNHHVADPQLAAALVLYAEGKINAAIVQLQTVKEKSSKAALHAKAEALRKDIANVDSLTKIADGMLKKNELEKAAKTYREALDLDGRLMPEGQTSQTRRTIQNEVAEAALRIGAPLARRPDLPKACAAFRTGFAIFKGNTGLNEAVGRDCSANAKAQLDRARTCEDLDRALVLAIPPDGIAEEIAAQRLQFNCPIK